MKKWMLVFAIPVFFSCQSGSTDKGSESDSSATGKTDTEEVLGPNNLTETEKAEGWQLLFDGISKNGWHVYQNKSDGSSWKVADGTLYMDPAAHEGFQTAGGGDLVTDSTFSNFHLSLEWKIADSGNSGIMFNVQEDPKYEYSFNTGPEMQVLDNNGHPDAKIIKHRAGDLYDLIASSSEPVKPAGEWNKAEIVLNNGKLDLYMNGVNVVSTIMWNDAWKKMVAGSKFKEWPDFGTFKSGHIAIQDHGNQVWFRNIKIKKL